MKRLFLLRHAKAGFATSDRARPLTKHGTKEALWLGQYLKAAHMMPDHILCSDAERTKETLSLLLEAGEIKIPAHIQDDLYLASAQLMSNQIQRLKSDINSAMIIGHNPGIAILFQQLASKSAIKKRHLKYPPCTLGILDFDMGDWADLNNDMGQMVEFIIPSDNMGRP